MSSFACPLLVTPDFPPDRGGVARMLGYIRQYRPDAIGQVLHLRGGNPWRTGGTWSSWVARSPGLLRRAAFRLGVQQRVGPSLRACPGPILAGHAHLASALAPLARRRGRPLVVFVYGVELWPAPAADRGVGPMGEALRRADLVLGCSQYARQLALAWGVRSERALALPLGIEPGLFAPTPLPPGPPVLLTVGHLVARKGQDTVIAALPELRQSFPGLRYRIAGQGPQRAALEEQARGLGVLAAVEFLGEVSEGDLPGLYADAHAFVMPCRQTADGDVEGFGLVFLEAAAAQRPVIAGRSGGASEAVVDGTTGLVIDPGDPKVLAAAVTGLLSDPALMERMGRAGRARVEKTHSAQAMADAAAEAILALQS